MRLFATILVLCNFLLITKAAEAQFDWFVINKPVASEPEENIESKQVVEEEKSLLEEPILAKEELRFAKNNRDINLAQSWLKAETGKNPENMVVSPMLFNLTSIIIANGLTDTSLYEFSKIIPILRLSDENTHMKEYLTTKSKIIDIYTSIWGKSFSERYQQNMSALFKTEIWGLQDKTTSIDEWINTRTEGAIKQIASEQKVDSNNIFIANAAILRGSLRSPFFATNTQKKVFYNADDEKEDVMMMENTISAEYYEDETMQAIKLPYITDDNITIYLPKKDINIKDFITLIDINKLKPLFKQTKDIKISIPKFEIEYGAKNVKALYELLGVKQMFNKDNFDFAKMVSYDEQRLIKNIYLKAKIGLSDVENKGEDKDHKKTENKLEFNANRPFVFMVNNGDFIGLFVHGTKP